MWDETCEQLLSANVQCHIVQLPGFAGQPPTQLSTSESYLESMRDRLLAYISAKKLHNPVLLGHSLGGVIALQMALKAPEQMQRLIIVDALPFLPAAQAADTKVDDISFMAKAMRIAMKWAPESFYQSQIEASLTGMTRNVDRLKRLKQWGVQSDHQTTVQAMYEMNTTDLRAKLDTIRQPTLVLASWAEFATFGGTQASVRQTFAEQYRKLKNVRIEMSETGYHFLMWDDNPWLVAQIKEFLTPSQASLP